MGEAGKGSGSCPGGSGKHWGDTDDQEEQYKPGLLRSIWSAFTACKCSNTSVTETNGHFCETCDECGDVVKTWDR